MSCGPSFSVSNGSPSVAPPAGWSTVYEVDFGAQGNVSIVNGQNVLADGRSFTGVNVGNATLFGFVDTVGLMFSSAAVSTGWNSAPAFTASAIWISLNDPTLPAAQRLIPDYDIHRQYVFQLHNTANNGNAANEIVSFNLWAPAAVPYSTAADRMGAVCKGGVAAVASGCGAVSGTATPILIGSYAADDVICFAPCVGQPSAVGCSCGTYDTAGNAWPDMQDLHECGWFSSTGAPAAATAVRYNDPSMRLAIAFPTGNASGTFAATVRRMRVLVWG